MLKSDGKALKWDKRDGEAFKSGEKALKGAEGAINGNEEA